MVYLGFQVCRPKELLIGLLEQLEQDDPDVIAESILLLLIPLQKGKVNTSFFLFLLLLVKTQTKLLPSVPVSVAPPGKPQAFLSGHDPVLPPGPAGQTASASHQGARGG